MEEHIASLQGIADEYEKRPSWEKLGENDPSNEGNVDISKYFPDQDAPKKKSAYWLTTNGEYGRYYTLRQELAAQRAPGTPALTPAELSRRAMELLGSRPPSGRDPGASARSRAECVAADEARRTEERAESIARASNGTSLPERRARYLTLHGSQPQESEMEPDRRKLTTGYAKQYMRTSHQSFWDNVQRVAPGAGFTVTSQPASRSNSNAEVLKVEYPGLEGGGEYMDQTGGDIDQTGGDIDLSKYMTDNYMYDIPEKGSRPASQQSAVPVY